MPRPSLREQRRSELIEAFERVFSVEGHEGATMGQVAAAAGVRPGLLHHYFESKDEMVRQLLVRLDDKFRARTRQRHSLGELLVAALALDARSDTGAAMAWVGIFAEAIRNRGLRTRLRRVLRRYALVFRTAAGDEDIGDGALALTVGFLVLGAIDPSLTRGRAASIAARLTAPR